MANDDIDSNYTDICSERTIFSNEKGFFGEMFDCIKSNCDAKWIENTFDSALSDMDKLKQLYEGPIVSDTVLGTLEHVTSVYRQKDAHFSLQRRSDGERLYEKAKSCATITTTTTPVKQKDFENALIFLTQAVLRAPAKGIDLRFDGGLTLALAFWMRSAVLLQLNRGADALVDIQCAIDNGLESVKTKPEYFARLAKANALNGDKCKTQICLNLAKSIFEGSGRSNEFNQLKRELEVIQHRPTTAPITTRSDVLPDLIGGEHKSLKGASRKMELRISPESGNFLVANETIRAGDTLVVENPIAACILPKFFGSHCLHCMKRITTAYGCSNCAGVAFCSPKCSAIACSTHHRIECKFIDLLVGSGMSILCFIALRMVTQHSDDVFAAIEKNRRIVHELCSHSKRRKSTDYFQRAVMSAFLLRILQKADYFGPRTSESAYPNSQAEFEIGEILIGLLQVLQFNAHEVSDLIHSDDSSGSNEVNHNSPPKYGRLVYIGVAIYNSAAYFNHNCYPAVTRYFVGKTIVLCASRPLEPGSVIAENYGPIFTRQTLRERQRSLSSRYWFRCDCISCKENWPILDKLDDNARLRCPTNGCTIIHKFPADKGKRSVTCAGCKCQINLQMQIATKTAAEDLYCQAAQMMADRKPREAAIAFITGINLFYTAAVPPHRSTHIAQESLRTCLTAIGRV